MALAVTILARWIGQGPNFALWMFAIGLFLGPMIAMKVVERHRRRQFHNETSRFFDRMLLGTRSGTSAREVLRRISQDQSFGFHTRDLADASLRDDSALFEIGRAHV